MKKLFQSMVGLTLMGVVGFATMFIYLSLAFEVNALDEAPELDEIPHLVYDFQDPDSSLYDLHATIVNDSDDDVSEVSFEAGTIYAFHAFNFDYYYYTNFLSGQEFLLLENVTFNKKGGKILNSPGGGTGSADVYYFYCETSFVYNFNGRAPSSTTHFFSTQELISYPFELPSLPYLQDDYSVNISAYTDTTVPNFTGVHQLDFKKGFVYAFPSSYRSAVVQWTGGLMSVSVDYRSIFTNQQLSSLGIVEGSAMEALIPNAGDGSSQGPQPLFDLEYFIALESISIDIPLSYSSLGYYGSTWPYVVQFESKDPYSLFDYYFDSKIDAMWEDISTQFTWANTPLYQTNYFAFDGTGLNPGDKILIAINSYYLASRCTFDVSVQGYVNPATSMPFPEELNNPVNPNQYPVNFFYEIQDFGTSFRAIIHDQDLTTAVQKGFKVYRLIEDTFPPQFNHQGTYAYIVDSADRIPLADILLGITATDDQAGDITDRITILSDGYTGSTGIGSFEVMLSVRDDYLNETVLKLIVQVLDKTAPEISGKASYNISNSVLFDLEIVKANLVVTDNIDALADITITLSIDNYSFNYQTAGIYILKYQATDSSGNSSTFDVTMNVLDGQAPVIYGVFSYKKSPEAILTLQDILSLITAHDESNGDLTAEIFVIEDNYTGFGNIVGKHLIVLGVRDASGNLGTKTIEVTVVDGLPPVFVLDDKFVFVESDILLTQNDFVVLLKSMHGIASTASVNIDIDLTLYDENSDVPGVYAMPYTIASSTGSEVSGILTVEVLASSTNIVGDSTAFDDFKGWFRKNIYEPLGLEMDFEAAFWTFVILAAFGFILLVVLIVAVVKALTAPSKKTKRRRRR